MQMRSGRLLVLKGKDVEFEACGGHLSSFFVRGVEIVARKKSCKENLEWILWQDRVDTNSTSFDIT